MEKEVEKEEVEEEDPHPGAEGGARPCVPQTPVQGMIPYHTIPYINIL